jgi:subfamily B ATP-binding cassette protein MsbA
VLLLDEPTSALDTESEALIQEALDRFAQDRTTVVVAHRLSTIKNADRVVVLNDGQIVEEGTHDDLLARGGMYLDLYQRQFALDQPGLPAQVGS